MQRRILSIALIACLSFSFFTWSCTKLDTTDIGSDLLAVDNVHTFDTLLNIITTQGVFNDSTIVSRTDDHALGKINNDPLFGTTTANVFMQLKPGFFPFYFGNEGDTLNGFGAGLDSVVLCLNYKGFWGDSALPLHLEVREVSDGLFRDSVYIAKTVNYQPNYTTLLGFTDVDVRRLGDTVKYANGRDITNYQVRIKLNAANPNQGWPLLLYTRDTLAGNAFLNDSLFRQFYNGLAVIANNSGGSNGLLYTNLADTSTKLEVHYRRRNRGKVDSIYTSLKLNSSFSGTSVSAPSNTTNNIIRNRPPRVSSPNSDEVFLQTSPGTYVNLNIPGLSTLSNRIIHRAEIIVEQIPTDPVLDPILSAPGFLYIDLKDTGTTDKWKPIYFDLSPNVTYDPDFKSGFPYYPSSQVVDYAYFGGFRRDKKDLFGNPINYYNFNISRYVQHIVTNHFPNYQMRLFAPFNFKYPQYSTDLISYSNNIANGRVRVGSGSNPNYKLRLRIVYSKL